MTNSALLKFFPSDLNQRYDLYSLDVSEGVSELFQIRMVLREKETKGPVFALPPGIEPPPPSAEFDPWLDKAISAGVMAEDEIMPRQLFHGVVTEYDSENNGATVLILEPHLAKYRERIQTRTFVNRYVGDVIRQVLSECEVDFKFSDKLAKRTLITQYRESDVDFVLRLIAANKLCFVFEHHKDKHIMFIGPSPRMHLPLKSLTSKPQFRFSQQQDDFTPAIMRWRSHRKFMAGKFERRDVRARDPYQVRKQQTISNSAGPKERSIVKSSPSTSIYPDDPHPILDQSDWGRSVIHSGGTYLVRPGELFIGPGAGSDNQFAVIHVQHSIQEGLTDSAAGYFNSFTCLSSTVQFTPDLLPTPCANGLGYATVVAADGTVSKPGSVSLSEGRVWVRIDDDTSPTPKVPVRLAQGLPQSFGTPRVGQRVIIDYEDGNPDRPLVVAVAPEATTSSMPHNPEKTPEAFTARFPTKESKDNKDQDAVLQVNEGRMAVQAPGGFFARVSKVFSILSRNGLFARGKTIVLNADDEIILKGAKISIIVGGCHLVMDGTNISIDAPGKIFLGGGGPSASAPITPDDDGRPQ